MSVGTVRFYRMRGSLSSGEYPLFSQGQDLSAFLVGSATVKYAKGLQTHISVPVFTGYDTANIAELDGQYYWVTEFRESTTVNGSVEYVLDFCAPTSFFRRSDSVKGNWHKLPYRSGYMRQQIMNDVIKVKDRVLFDELDCPDNLYWVQASGIDSDNKVQIYGWFVEYLDSGVLDFAYGAGYLCDASGTHHYPTIYELYKSISDTLPGLTAQTLIDVSISKRCPFRFIQASTEIPSRKYVQLKGLLSPAVAPNTTNANGRYLYDMTPDNISELLDVMIERATATITLNLSDMETDCGNVAVMDWNRNTVMQIIPTDIAALTITASMYTDISGVFTIISSGDQQITLTEGKMPYFENTWDTYRAYQMDSDRMAMINAIEYARQQAEIDVVTGVMNTAINAASTGVMTGAITSSKRAGVGVGILSQVAGTAVSLYASDRQRQLSEMKAENDFLLSQKRAIQQPQTAYNTAYGQIYCKLNEINPLCVTVSLPDHMNADYYTNWCNDMGFPAEGVSSESIRTGFYQGKILSNSVTRTGMYWDRCNEIFMIGFKFVTP